MLICLADSLPLHSITDIELQKINFQRNLYCKQFSIRNDLHINSDLSLRNNSECNYCETKHIQLYLYRTNGSKNFTYFHFNIRSLRKNFKSLEQLVNLNLLPDVIRLTETKIKINALNYIPNQLPGYQFLHSDSATNSGGVGILIKDNVDFVLRGHLQFKSLNCENLWLELKNQNIIIGVV